MKKLLATMLLALAFAAQAQAVDVTITITPSELSRAQVALGKVKDLRDGANLPRIATPTEVKTFVIERFRALIVDVEGRELTKAATDAVVVPLVDPK